MRLLLVCLLAAVSNFGLSSAAVSSGHGNVPLVTKVDFEPTPTLFNYPPNHHKENGFCSEIKITFTLSPEAKLADVEHSGLFSLRRTAISQVVYDDHLWEAQSSKLEPLEWPVDAQSHQLNSAKLAEIFVKDAKRKQVEHKVSEDSPNFQNVVCDEEHKKIVVTDCPGPTMQAAVSDPKLYPVMFQGEFTLTLVYYRQKADVALKKGIKLAEVSYSTVNGKKAITSSVAPDIIYEKAAVKGDIFIAKDSSTLYVEPVVQSAITLEEADRINKFQCWENQLKPHKPEEPSPKKKKPNQTPLSPSLPEKKGHRRTSSSGGGKVENTLKRTGSSGNLKQRKALTLSK